MAHKLAARSSRGSRIGLRTVSLCTSAPTSSSTLSMVCYGSTFHLDMTRHRDRPTSNRHTTELGSLVRPLDKPISGLMKAKPRGNHRIWFDISSTYVRALRIDGRRVPAHRPANCNRRADQRYSYREIEVPSRCSLSPSMCTVCTRISFTGLKKQK